MDNVINMADWKRQKAVEGVAMALPEITKQIRKWLKAGMSMPAAREIAREGLKFKLLRDGSNETQATLISEALSVAAALSLSLGINGISDDSA